MSLDLKNFGTNFEEKILQAVILDEPYAVQMMEVLDPELLDLKFAKEISKVLIEYYFKYNSFPSLSLLKEILEQQCITNNNKAVLVECNRFFESLVKNPLNGDSEFVKEKSLQYFRTQSVKNALLKDVIPQLEKGDNLENVIPMMEKAISKGTSRDLGLCYNDDEARFEEEKILKVPTPWERINEVLNGGLGQKRLITVIGPAGSGKSHFLINLGIGALLDGKTVVHYTMELDEIEVARRYDAGITNVAINDIPYQKSKVLHILKNKMPANANLIIKEYPMKKASVQTIKGHLSRLKIQNIKPHIILIDYGDLLSSSESRDQKRFDLELIWQEMKRMAQEMLVPVVTLTQTNRAGYDNEVVYLTDVSEDFSKIMTSDVIFTMSRNFGQKQTGIGNIHLGKNRQGKDGMVFPYKIQTDKCNIEILENDPEVTSENLVKALKGEATTDVFQKYLNEKKKAI